jgi:hypothetical protein
MLRAHFLIRSALLLVAALLASAPVALGTPSVAHAQQEEARVLFERGNEHLARGLRSHGRRRAQELEQALDAYLGVVRLGARTRNVVYNIAIVFQELGRHEEAFNYYSEYLRTFDLSEEDRADGQRRLDALRPQVAVLSLGSAPEGAEVRVDRRDLPVRGTTPLELALPAGPHRLFFAREGYEEMTVEASARTGEVDRVSAALVARPVPVQVIAPSGGRLTLDDAEIVAGRAVPVAPGAHVVRLELPGAPPVERRFEVQAGSEAMTLELSATASVQPTGGTLAIQVDAPSQIFLDGVRIGSGTRVDAPALAGGHMLRIESPGRQTATHRFSLDLGQQLALGVTMREGADGGVIAGRAITGVLALAGIGVSAYFIARSVDLHDTFERLLAAQDSGQPFSSRELNAVADDLELHLAGMDIGLAVTALTGTLAIVLLAVDAGGGESTVEVLGAPTPGGGTLQARLTTEGL